MRKNNQQYTAEDIQSSRNYLLKLSQGNFSTPHFIPFKVELNSIPGAK